MASAERFELSVCRLGRRRLYPLSYALMASLSRVELEQLRFGTSAAESAARDLRGGPRCRPWYVAMTTGLQPAERAAAHVRLSGLRILKPHLWAHNPALCL